ncbi:MAG: 4-hydroxythreonine-4-phosphate dehydrogenase PdxA [Bacteroidales bacterium]|nr:4-hydroxythreonine-4-phosphate dehydrogenase PdxA [Bacteroidales bacterium]
MTDYKHHIIGITQGDVNGISYEVILKSLCDNKIMDICTPVVYGLAKAASFHKKYMNIPDFSFQFVKNTDQLSNKRPNLINIFDDEVKIDLGNGSKVAGQMAERALYAAGRDLKNKRIDAIVTAPINKESIQSDKFTFSGHTEFLEHYFGSKENPALMMMVDQDLRIAFATNHLPMQEAINALTPELLYQKLEILDKSLREDFAIDNPTIAVLALNPHASDNGLVGNEEKDILRPTIEKAFQNHINAFGPFPTDSFFAYGSYRKFDAVMALYYDQGMIPFKMLTSEGVDYTAGLPIVRTAPAHGTAYDIAGKNVADSQAMRNAIYLAVDIVRNRKNHQV